MPESPLNAHRTSLLILFGSLRPLIGRPLLYFGGL